MELLQNLQNALQALYDHVGFVEDWTVYAVDDRSTMLWTIVDDGRKVRFAETIEKLHSDDDYYEDEICMHRHYRQWVYRGELLTMIMVDTHTDGNRFFAFFRNANEVKKSGVPKPSNLIAEHIHQDLLLADAMAANT